MQNKVKLKKNREASKASPEHVKSAAYHLPTDESILKKRIPASKLAVYMYEKYLGKKKP